MSEKREPGLYWAKNGDTWKAYFFSEEGLWYKPMYFLQSDEQMKGIGVDEARITQARTRQEFIAEIVALIASGEITDVESIGSGENWSRTKKQNELRSERWAAVGIGKHFIYIKK